MTAELREGMLVGMGNPLLDISVVAPVSILDKYNLKSDDAILAEEKHMPLYKEISKFDNVEYIAGGSSLNSLRVAQWHLRKPNIAVQLGCVSKDENGSILEKKAREGGVNVKFQYTDKKPTGTCAVIVTQNGAHRSLCANLAAAECFTKDHIESPDVKKILSQAEFYYFSGFFLTVSIETILEVAQLALQRNKICMMNLSAPFLSIFYKKQMMQALPYVDILFGNETEALTFSKEQSLQTEDLHEIALKLTNLPKQNGDRQRVVVLTQGTKPVILAQDGKTTEFPVDILSSSEIVDTNGAGDAFVGGFLAQLVKGEQYDVCIKCGIWSATQIIKSSGCTFQGIPDFEVA